MFIYFDEECDARKVLEIIADGHFGSGVQELIHVKPGSGLAIAVKDETISLLIEALSAAIHTFIISSKIYAWMENIIKAKFFYVEQEEIDQIVEIAGGIIENRREKELFNVVDQRTLAENLLAMLLSEVSFSFDSFARFRLKGITESLMPFIEQAIDEYKMEQDYQDFIQTLRDFMLSQPGKTKALHLLHDEALHFYNESFMKLENGELSRLVDRRLLAENPVYIDSKTIAPLISIAPQKLVVYTDKMEDGLIQTILRIFEERSTLKTRDSFAKERQLFFEQPAQ
ncbi:sporulation protein YtxC [Peribacillus sp. SCS-26]|uniref:sporulation protein YtxC n=1 Tax=Paraperibacillus marinus TaxID=3115295 RepID=UPI0039061FA3